MQRYIVFSLVLSATSYPLITSYSADGTDLSLLCERDINKCIEKIDSVVQIERDALEFNVVSPGVVGVATQLDQTTRSIDLLNKSREKSLNCFVYSVRKEDYSQIARGIPSYIHSLPDKDHKTDTIVLLDYLRSYVSCPSTYAEDYQKLFWETLKSLAEDQRNDKSIGVLIRENLKFLTMGKTNVEPGAGLDPAQEQDFSVEHKLY